MVTTSRSAEMLRADDEANQDDIASAQRVLAIEEQGLTALSDALSGSLGGPFQHALNIIEAVTGRVVVTGMGKSGHVGRKIAATMASVGTPAFYVHPGEASHGDMGMISANDAVLALSNSGETAELGDTIAYCSRFSIPLIGMTSGAGSVLATASQAALVLPAVPEACPLGLAPTTSTTMMIALGDALAVALLERRNFTAEHFKALHPGGKLGSKLQRVANLMHVGDEMPLVPPTMPMGEVLLVMTSKRMGSAGVINDKGSLIGIITDGDLRRHMSAELTQQAAKAIMNEGPKTIHPDALAAEALAIMNDQKITSLFVVLDGKPVGFVHMHDCLQAGVA